MNYDVFNEFYDVNDNGFFRILFDVYPAEYNALFGAYDVALDVYLLSKISDKIVTNYYSKLFLTDATPYEKIAHVIHKLHYKNWLRIVNIMNENYNVFDVAVEHYAETTHTDNRNTLTYTGNTQNKANSYDNASATNTDSTSTNNESANDVVENRTMSYDKTSTGALFTPMELLEKEINVRRNFNVLDIVIGDISKTLCLDIY